MGKTLLTSDNAPYFIDLFDKASAMLDDIYHVPEAKYEADGMLHAKTIVIVASNNTYKKHKEIMDKIDSYIHFICKHMEVSEDNIIVTYRGAIESQTFLISFTM